MEVTKELLNSIEHDGLSDAETTMLYTHLRDLAKKNDKRVFMYQRGRGYCGIFHGKVLTVGTYGNGKQFKAECRPAMKFDDAPPVSDAWTTLWTALQDVGTR